MSDLSAARPYFSGYIRGAVGTEGAASEKDATANQENIQGLSLIKPWTDQD
jgi:hypothetical protein